MGASMNKPMLVIYVVMSFMTAVIITLALILYKSNPIKEDTTPNIRVIAVDFDGCLCTNNYPLAGEPNWEVINAIKREKSDGAKIILWTCRCGKDLKVAVNACKSWGLEFDAVNDNIKEWKDAWGNNTRKVGATEYWDDKAVNKRC